MTHQPTLGDLKGHLKQQGFGVENMTIDETSNEAASFKSFRIITSGILRKSLLDADGYGQSVSGSEIMRHITFGYYMA